MSELATESKNAVAKRKAITPEVLARPIGDASTVKDVLEGAAKQIAAVLPKRLTPERLTRVVLIAVNQNPDLLKCTGTSLMQSIMSAAALGLEPGSGLGHAYLVPYGSKCQLIIGYRGFIDLARRSGEIESIAAHPVHERDKFSVRFGTDERIEHEPFLDGDRGPIRLFYAVAKLKDGGIVTEVMTKAEVDKAREASKVKSGPWANHYSEMGRKTVVRRLAKYLPLSIEAADALDESDRVEFAPIQLPGATTPPPAIAGNRDSAGPEIDIYGAIASDATLREADEEPSAGESK